ncbi:MAG TPA: hypothetical protein VMF32_11760 [Xanthobacteraceae bacterium]|nr:hypothetical protein [Xanthobacteraceae bacterium]
MRRRKLSPARRAQLEQELAKLRVQYIDLRTKSLHTRGRQRKEAEAACLDVGQRIDAILYRFSEDNWSD